MSQAVEMRYCKHTSEVIATYTTGNKYYLCKNCYADPLFSDSKFLVSLVEIISENKK